MKMDKMAYKTDESFMNLKQKKNLFHALKDQHLVTTDDIV